MIDFAIALEEAIRATRIERYRWLCSEANTLPPPNDRETWRQFILNRRWEPAPGTPAPDVNTGIGWVPPGPCGGC